MAITYSHQSKIEYVADLTILPFHSAQCYNVSLKFQLPGFG